MSTMTFTDAYQRLRDISLLVQKQDSVDIEKLMELQKEAKELHTFCQGELKKGEELKVEENED